LRARENWLISKIIFGNDKRGFFCSFARNVIVIKTQFFHDDFFKELANLRRCKFTLKHNMGKSHVSQAAPILVKSFDFVNLSLLIKILHYFGLLSMTNWQEKTERGSVIIVKNYVEMKKPKRKDFLDGVFWE